MEQFAVISDVHGNMEALEAVLKDAKARSCREILFLGDAVGYGPNPNECVALLGEACRVLLAGNHDWAVLGLTDVAYFNEHARAAVHWTREVLTEESAAALRAFPLTKKMRPTNSILVHATPKEPEAWHYLLSLWDAEVNFHYFDERICFLGHSHHPFVIERTPSGEMITYRKEATLRKSGRYIINAGSVGQPRDRDPRACYVIVNGDALEFVRVKYDIRKTQGKMYEAGLPQPLIERLAQGT